MAIRYPADVATQARLAPLDPDAVKKVEIDITSWLDGDSLTNHLLSSDDSNIVFGNGVLTKTLGSGDVVTPPASTESAGIITGYVWDDGTGTTGTDYTMRLSLYTGFRGDDRTFVFQLAER